MDRRDLLPPGLGGPLTPGEERLTKCAASGEWWKPEIPTGVGFDSDPAKASTWPKECKVRAEVIYCLLTGVPWEKGSDIWSVHPKGLQLLNAYIDGKLDLEGCYLLASFWLHSSKVVGNVILMDATTRTVSFRRSHIQALNAERSTVEGALHLQGLHANQGVNLRSAYIRGQLACAGALLANENGAALNGGEQLVDVAQQNVGSAL